jgi:hypothetical protein
MEEFSQEKILVLQKGEGLAKRWKSKKKYNLNWQHFKF